jgi:hypothetical protein
VQEWAHGAVVMNAKIASLSRFMAGPGSVT